MGRIPLFFMNILNSWLEKHGPLSLTTNLREDSSHLTVAVAVDVLITHTSVHFE